MQHTPRFYIKKDYILHFDLAPIAAFICKYELFNFDLPSHLKAFHRLLVAAADCIQLPYLYTFYTDYDYSRSEISFLVAVYYFSAALAAILLGIAADQW